MCFLQSRKALKGLISKLLGEREKVGSLTTSNEYKRTNVFQISPVPQCPSGSSVPTILSKNESEQHGQSTWPFNLHFFGPYCHKPFDVLLKP